MPQVSIKDMVSLIEEDENILSPVIGHIPPLARVAAITAPDSHVISREHSCQKKNNNKYDNNCGKL